MFKEEGKRKKVKVKEKENTSPNTIADNPAAQPQEPVVESSENKENTAPPETDIVARYSQEITDRLNQLDSQGVDTTTLKENLGNWYSTLRENYKPDTDFNIDNIQKTNPTLRVVLDGLKYEDAVKEFEKRKDEYSRNQTEDNREEMESAETTVNVYGGVFESNLENLGENSGVDLLIRRAEEAAPSPTTPESTESDQIEVENLASGVEESPAAPVEGAWSGEQKKIFLNDLSSKLVEFGEALKKSAGTDAVVAYGNLIQRFNDRREQILNEPNFKIDSLDELKSVFSGGLFDEVDVAVFSVLIDKGQYEAAQGRLNQALKSPEVTVEEKRARLGDVKTSKKTFEDNINNMSSVGEFEIFRKAFKEKTFHNPETTSKAIEIIEKDIRTMELQSETKKAKAKAKEKIKAHQDRQQPKPAEQVPLSPPRRSAPKIPAPKRPAPKIPLSPPTRPAPSPKKKIGFIDKLRHFLKNSSDPKSTKPFEISALKNPLNKAIGAALGAVGLKEGKRLSWDKVKNILPTIKRRIKRQQQAEAHSKPEEIEMKELTTSNITTDVKLSEDWDNKLKALAQKGLIEAVKMPTWEGEHATLHMDIKVSQDEKLHTKMTFSQDEKEVTKVQVGTGELNLAQSKKLIDVMAQIDPNQKIAFNNLPKNAQVNVYASLIEKGMEAGEIDNKTGQIKALSQERKAVLDKALREKMKTDAEFKNSEKLKSHLGAAKSSTSNSASAGPKKPGQSS